MTCIIYRLEHWHRLTGTCNYLDDMISLNPQLSIDVKQTAFLGEVLDSEVARLAAAGAVHGGGAWLDTPTQHEGDGCRGNTYRRGSGISHLPN